MKCCNNKFKIKNMKRTHLEVSKDLQFVIDLGMKALYWYLSLVLMVLSMAHFGYNGFAGDISLAFSLGFGALYIWYALCFTWNALNLKDYNGAPYWISNIFRCYFKGTWILRKHEEMYK